MNPTGPDNPRGWVVEMIDLATGQVHRRMRGIVPLAPMRFWYLSSIPPARDGHDYLFLDDEGNLTRINVVTGVQSTILRPGNV